MKGFILPNFWHSFSYIASLGLVVNYSIPLSALTVTSNEIHARMQYLAQQANCRNPQTQSEINYCAEQSRRRADQELNRVYRLVVPKLAAARRNQLVNAQTAWIKFRDAECDFSSSLAEGGTMQPGLEAGCLEQVTRERTSDLNSYLQGRTQSATGNNYRASDNRLNQVYQQLRQRLPAARNRKLQTAESAWIEFRDAACEFEGTGGGNAVRNSCLIRTTEQRTRQLEAHLDTSNL